MKKNSADVSAVGFKVYPSNVDSRMWDWEFTALPKCSRCGFRLDFLASNSKYRPLRASPDLADTWDSAHIASENFRRFCIAKQLRGVEFRGFDSTNRHFHMVPTRFVRIDEARSKIVVLKLCQKCGNPESRITRGNPTFLSVDTPLRDGFWASDVLFGNENTKAPSLIVNHRTRRLLEHASRLKLRLDFEPVYADKLAESREEPGPRKKALSLPPARARRKKAVLDLKPLKTLLAAPDAGFRCSLVGGRKEQAIIRVTHEFAGAAPGSEVKKANEVLGSAGYLLVAFLKLHNGASLYCDPSTDTSGVRIFAIKEWRRETVAMRQWFTHLSSKERPVILKHAVAFAEPTGSGHHFAIVTEGKDAGAILLTNHETLTIEEFAGDFNEFLAAICSDPVDLLVNQLGGYARYTHANVREGWVPVEYSPEAWDL